MRARHLLSLLSAFVLMQASLASAQAAPASTNKATAGAPNTLPPPGTPVPSLPPLPSVDKASFESLKQDMMPLTPEMIRDLHRATDAEERAASEPPRFVPKPVSSSLVAVLSPGATPPVVRLFANYVSNVLFIDEAGSPLNIENVDVPGKDTFTVTWATDASKRSNGLTISPNSMYTTGNIAVHLTGVATPVSVMLVSGQREIDTRADIRVAGVGRAGRGDSLPGAASAGLQSFLDGVPPKTAKPLTSSLPGIQVWSLDAQFVVVAGADLSLISPAYTERKSSADGTTVYVIPQVSPLVALSDGNSLSITVSGY